MFAAFAAVLLGETCQSGLAGDTAGTGCAAWCKVEKAKHHCKFCKCSGCDFCKAPAAAHGGVSTPAALASPVGEGAALQSHRRAGAASAGAASACAAREGTVPFAMWMPGRTGSTWVQEALNSHPEISMLGEVFNNGTDGEGFSRNMCRFYGAPVGRRVRRVRGFKQKFFQCDVAVVTSADLPGPILSDYPASLLGGIEAVGISSDNGRVYLRHIVYLRQSEARRHAAVRSSLTLHET